MENKDKLGQLKQKALQYKIKIINMLKKFGLMIGNFEMVSIFIFMSSYLIKDFSLFQRILFSIGLAYLYKEFIADIIKIIVTGKK